jgi:hypothetical protein
MRKVLPLSIAVLLGATIPATATANAPAPAPGTVANAPAPGAVDSSAAGVAGRSVPGAQTSSHL